jgi:hypothetical protein
MDIKVMRSVRGIQISRTSWSSVAEPKLFVLAPAPAPAMTFKKFPLRLQPELCGYLFLQLLNEKVDFP